MCVGVFEETSERGGLGYGIIEGFTDCGRVDEFGSVI